MAGLCAPLATLRLPPHEGKRTAWGRCGSLLPHRSGLSPPTPCRFLRRTDKQDENAAAGVSKGGRSPTGCAWHGHWIGGESPSRGEVVATASRRQLHAVFAVVRRQRWRREAVWGRSPRRTAAPNASEPLSKPG